VEKPKTDTSKVEHFQYDRADRRNKLLANLGGAAAVALVNQGPLLQPIPGTSQHETNGHSTIAEDEV
jgi:hypothetical protein